MATRYAVRVGVLQEKDLFDNLRASEKNLKEGESPDVQALADSLTRVIRLITPMTLADLHGGRDPFLPKNQSRARIMQLWLTSVALIALFFIGYFMQSLRAEQEAIQTLHQIQDLKPQQKLTALRKMAQFERPLERPNTSYETYHQKASELMQINGTLMLSYNSAVEAAMLPLFPSWTFWVQSRQPMTTQTGSAMPEGPASAPASASPLRSASAMVVSKPTASTELTPQPSAIPLVSPSGETISSSAPQICVQEADGSIKLPSESLAYPEWMRNVLSDSLSDFCFQLKVLAPGGQGTLLNASLGQLAFAPAIREKVSLRLNWFLPFFYGVLGSIIFVMRNIASVRTPAVEWFPILMRVSLGGVAGIVIGWFSSSATLGVDTTATALSIPFALAFLTGYGIEVLFSVLDKLIRTVGDSSKRA